MKSPILLSVRHPQGTIIANWILRISSPVLNYEEYLMARKQGQVFGISLRIIYELLVWIKFLFKSTIITEFLNKATGAQLSVVSIETFWNSLGVDGDNVLTHGLFTIPYNNRWIVAAVSKWQQCRIKNSTGISRHMTRKAITTFFLFDPDPGTANWAGFSHAGF